ncbi:serine/threonine protein kinase [Lentimonas sp. CC4]|nr:serine/threonine protein kinase [Lentimonas sp. CC4]CAA6686998.1 serine/threonine protein kinase [Lentimonas sp. CC6]CAA7075841.1 serine/threonine protein kinase [Lentimonas sp. CC4]CAA7172033.1 serine/threonine protein kinase [Lentimonas sp. CC21]CAA7182904.1 serine/threonine protein kinase [Lentimonas sp. CC8]
MSKGMHIKGELRVRYGQATSAGVKPQNEDCLGIQIPDGDLLTTKGLVVVVADGVSAAEAGKEASEFCVKSFINDYFSTPETWEVKTAAHRVLVSLNRWLFSKGQSLADERRGYVAAMSALILKARSAHIFHVGDTRIYRFRDGALEPLTQDHHTWVSSETCYLSRAMGMGINLDIDYRKTVIEPGDVLFFSTDGVHEHLKNSDISALLADPDVEPDAACQQLIDLALANGSRDNLSCQILRVESLPDANSNDIYDALSRLPFPPALKVGMSLDGYQVEAVLHESSRSQLYQVRDKETGERMAMKTPSVNFSDDAAYIERFIMEEWIGRRIANQHIVRTVEQARPPQCLYYLMENVEGKTLKQWMTENPSPEIGIVVDIVRQIVDGLRALHRRETLHQDLKPDNIMIQSDGVVKIIDLGSAYIAGIHETSVPFEREQNLGTMKYSAPEYKLGRRPSTRSDQFSLAMIAYELFTGGQGSPYGEKFAAAHTLRDFSALGYQPAARTNPLVPGWVDGALKKALSLNSELRYEVLSEFVVDLKQPNPQFLESGNMPLIQRDPLRFWKGLSAVLGAMVVVLLFLLMK